MQPQTIDVIFRGMCAVVHDRAPDELPVVLVRGEAVPGVMAHDPFLAIEQQHLAGRSTAQPTWVAGSTAVWSLKGKAMTLIGFDATPSGIELVGAEPPIREHPAHPLDQQSLCWIPRMSKVCGTEFPLNPDLVLKPGSGPAPPIQSGLVTLDRGWVMSDPDGPINGRWVWKLADGVSHYVGDVVVCRAEILNGVPMVALSDLETGQPAGTIPLQISDGRIHLEVTNLPPMLGGSEDRMPHFQAYFQLLAYVPPNTMTPVRIRPCVLSQDDNPGVSAKAFANGKCVPVTVP